MPLGTSDSRSSQDDPTAAILIIGDEILCGQIRDSNVHFLTTRLGDLGIRVCEARVVGDVYSAIISAVHALRVQYTYVFSTGGIGPTHDDKTADAMAQAFGRVIMQHPEAVARLNAHYGDQINATRLRMARIPEGATLIDNPASAAPGFQIENVFVMAGVPSIAQAMFSTLEPRLQQGRPLYAVSVRADIPESRIAEALATLQVSMSDVAFGSYPHFKPHGFGVALVARTHDYDKLISAQKALEALIIGISGLTPQTEWLKTPRNSAPNVVGTTRIE